MNPVQFPEANDKLAKSQPQFRMLPVFIGKINEGESNEHLQFICKYELSDLEIEQIIKTRSFYLSQVGNCFHPIYPSIESQFGYCIITFKKLDDGLYDLWIPMSDKSITYLKNVPLSETIEAVIIHSKLNAEQLRFVEKPDLGIDENGNIIGL